MLNYNIADRNEGTDMSRGCVFMLSSMARTVSELAFSNVACDRRSVQKHQQLNAIIKLSTTFKINDTYKQDSLSVKSKSP